MVMSLERGSRQETETRAAGQGRNEERDYERSRIKQTIRWSVGGGLKLLVVDESPIRHCLLVASLSVYWGRPYPNLQHAATQPPQEPVPVLHLLTNPSHTTVLYHSPSSFSASFCRRHSLSSIQFTIPLSCCCLLLNFPFATLSSRRPPLSSIVFEARFSWCRSPS